MARLGRIRVGHLMLLMAVSRLLLLLLVWGLTHGHELSNDVPMHMHMVRAPLAILLNQDRELGQHPPLLPVLEGVLGYPLQLVLSDFLTIRIIMIVWEVVLAWIFFELATALRLNDLRRGWGFAALLLLPTGWMVTAVMGQDDSIAACGVLLPVLLYVRKKERWGLFMAGFGMIAAKLFVVLDLLVLLAASSRRKFLKDAAVGFLPIVLVYGLMSAYRITHAQDLPLVGFRPDVPFGTNFWIVLHNYAGLDLHLYGIFTGGLALIGICVPAYLLARLPPAALTPARIVAGTAAGILSFFSLFYHIEPEYFTMVLPLLVLTSENASDAAWCVAVSVIPWAGKFFQNAVFLANAANTPGKYLAYRAFQTLFRSSPATWLWVDQIVFSVVSLYVCYRWCAKLVPRTTKVS